MKDIKILALDLGTEMGYYTGEGEPSTVKFEREARTVDFYSWLSGRVFDNGEPLVDVVVLENAFHQLGRANEVFHELKAVVKLVCGLAGVPLHEYSAKAIKKKFTGNGNADKQEVIDKCLELGAEIPFRIMKSGKNKGDKRYNDNAADAYAIYHTYVQEEL